MISVYRSGSAAGSTPLGSARSARRERALGGVRRCDVLSQPGRQHRGVEHAAPGGPVYARISLRWRCAMRLASSNDASSPAGTRIWRARCATASSGGSSAAHGKRPRRAGTQQRREPQPRRAGLVAQQIQLVAAQREVVDDRIQTQLARRLGGSPVDRVARQARDHVHDLERVPVQAVGDQGADDLRGRQPGIPGDALERVRRTTPTARGWPKRRPPPICLRTKREHTRRRLPPRRREFVSPARAARFCDSALRSVS